VGGIVAALNNLGLLNIEDVWGPYAVQLLWVGKRSGETHSAKSGKLPGDATSRDRSYIMWSEDRIFDSIWAHQRSAPGVNITSHATPLRIYPQGFIQSGEKPENGVRRRKLIFHQ